jgi:hypothetical protein
MRLLIDLVNEAQVAGIHLSPAERLTLLNIRDRIANGSNNPRRPTGPHVESVDEALGERKP